MRNTAIAVCLFVAGLMTYAAHAEELGPLQAATFQFRDHVASVYYLERGNSFHIVMTLAPNYDRAGAPMRFTAALEEGQTQILSIGDFGLGNGAAALSIERRGDIVTAKLIEPKSLSTH